MALIYIDKKPYEVKDGENLLKACLGLGFDLPYFCWHPALHSVGACRQCAVKQFKDEHDEKGMIVMACLTPVQDGMYVSIDDPEARRFRSSVIELFMTNHPHDCPVCDEGGECHLQDVTVMTGHVRRRFRFRKRTHLNQNLGPFVTHEMNRCIACYRCTRFYNDYALGRDFGAFASHNHVYFGRAADGALESEFSGNLVEICPTGVFTDKTLSRHYTRKWDLRTAPSVCIHCSLGCNTIPGERYGIIRRLRNRYNGKVNGYFLCDRGRYGYEFVNSDRRIREPMIRDNRRATLKPLKRGDAIEHAAAILASARGLIGIGSPRASLEANFALRRLVGEERFFAGTARQEHELTALAIDLVKKSPARLPSLSEIANCDAVFLLGEDISNTAPILSLNVLQTLRQGQMEAASAARIPYWDDRAVRVAGADFTGSLFVATTAPTRLDTQAISTLRGAPANLARSAFALAAALDEKARPVEGLTKAAAAFVEKAARALKAARRPLVISGVSSQEESLLVAAAEVARSLCRIGKEGSLCFALAECNSFGLGLMTTGNLEDAVAEVAQGRADAALIIENDLYRRAPAPVVDGFLEGLRAVVVVDHLFHRTALKADVLLPAATFAEGVGTYVNNEGRAQRSFQVFPPSNGAQASWRWIRDIMATRGRHDVRAWRRTDDIIASMAGTIPSLEKTAEAAPFAAFRIAGMRIAREHPRYSGRTAMDADKGVHEPKPPVDDDSPFSFTMEGFAGVPPSALVPRFWAPGWNSVQALNKFQEEVGGPLRGGDPGVRLVESGEEPAAEYEAMIPEPFSPQEGLFFVFPFYHVFGSDELSMLTPGIRSLAPEPYLALSPKDMRGLGVAEGEAVALSVDGRTYRLPAKRSPALPSGMCALGYGLLRSPVLAYPAWGKVEKA